MDFENRLLKLEERVTRLETGGNKNNDNVTKNNKAIAPREFLNSLNLSNDVERVLAIGFYLESNQSFASFNIEDIKAIFYSSKIKLPLNINDKINLNIKKGHIMDAPGKKDTKKAWILTGAGEAFIESLKKN